MRIQPRQTVLRVGCCSMTVLLCALPVRATAQPVVHRADATVLVNSHSASFADFGRFIQPYLDHFGIPYTVIDIGTSAFGAEIADSAAIIIGHRQLDTTGADLSASEQSYLTAAVRAGTGLINFDNDLWTAAGQPRYTFVQDVFGFDYRAPTAGSVINFTETIPDNARQINCWEDAHQDPVLPTTESTADLVPDDNRWTEFEYATRGYPGLFAGVDETPPLMRCHGAVPNGTYSVFAKLYWSDNLRYWWGYSAGAPEANSIDVTSGRVGDFDYYPLGEVTVTDGQFQVFFRNADPLPGGLDYPFWAWASIRLTPPGSPPSQLHYITRLHDDSETIITNPMTLAGITPPQDVMAVATSGVEPFLAVTAEGAGRAVQWGSYDWMSHTVRGPVYGLDDLVWRSLVWAARKPFAMQGLLPFVTMRVDDERGNFEWLHIANEFGLKPWVGLFYEHVDASEAADLSAIVRSGGATASVHAKGDTFFYYDHGAGNFPDSVVAANFAAATDWHNRNNIPISQFVLPHHYEFGSNVFQGLANWGVQFVGTMMSPGTDYGSPWLNTGPFRRFESGISSYSAPVYYADTIDIPGHPEIDGRFFNCVTEVRDDAGYEWYPDLTDVTGSVARGTRQVRRALDGMALGTLFTHGYWVSDRWSASAPAAWRAILQGITDNLRGYAPVFETMEGACRYVRAMRTSKIDSSVFEPELDLLRTVVSGPTDIPTKFHVFFEQDGAIRHLLVDVPVVTTQTTVSVTLPAGGFPPVLARIEVTPASVSLAPGASQQFTAHGYDASGNPVSLSSVTVTWSVLHGGGTMNSSGLFVAGAASGTFADTVAASVGGIAGHATVTVTAVNTPPTISDLPGQTTLEDTPTGVLAFTVGDAETPAGSLTVSATSSNTTLVPTANIVFGGSGANRTVRVTPAANRSGTATITVTVSDGTLSASDGFGLTVTAVNDAPTVGDIPDQTTSQGTPTSTLAFTVGDVETAAGSLTVSATSSNTTLVPTANIVFGGSGANRTVRVTPAANRSGTATITVTVSDGALTASDSFVLTVTADNTAPTISNISSQTTPEDTPTNALAFTVGDAETPAGSLTLSATSSNTILAPTANIVFGGSGANRTVRVTPAANQSGTATITVTVSDGARTASDSFGLTVTAVNDAPTISDIPGQTTLEDTATSALTFTVGDVETAAASLTVSATSGNTTLVPTANIVFGGGGANRTVRVTPAANRSGTATITVTVSDGTRTASDSFGLTVMAVNDAPTISDIPDQTTSQDTPTNAVAFTVGDVETTAGSLTLSATSSNTSLVPTANIVFGGSGASRTVRVTPAANRSGTATITVTVSDGTSTASDTFGLTVTASGATTLAYTGSSTGQYSDSVSLAAALAETTGTPVRGATVRFAIGTQTVDAVTDSAGVARTTLVLNQPAGSPGVTVTFAGAGRYRASSATAAFQVTQENAHIQYSGETFARADTYMDFEVIVRDSAATGYAGANDEAGSSRTIGDITKMWVNFRLYSLSKCGTGTPLVSVSVRLEDTGTQGNGIGSVGVRGKSASPAYFCVIASLVAGSSGGVNQWYTAATMAPVTVRFY